MTNVFTPSPVRLAIVVSHPIQYYSPWFRSLATHTGIDLRVYYLWQAGAGSRNDPEFQREIAWDIDLLSGYNHEFVPNVARRAGSDHFFGLINPSLGRRLAAWRPHAVLLFGYAYISNLALVAWSRWHGWPLLFRGDSHLLGRKYISWRVRWPLTFLYRQFAAFLPVGVANVAYFHALGAGDDRMFLAPHAVDATRFDPTEPATQSAAREIRARLGIPREAQVVLFAGKFSRAKEPLALLEAFLGMRRPGAVLLFVGSGTEETALRARAEGAMPGTIYFLPFANQSEMPVCYAAADLFVLPSSGLYETWGLAVNEAMHLGVPALVSDRVGCQQDLVTEGETGWVFSWDDPGSLGRQLLVALETLAAPASRARVRAAVLARIAQYTYAQTTAGLERALEYIALQRPAAQGAQP